MGLKMDKTDTSISKANIANHDTYYTKKNPKNKSYFEYIRFGWKYSDLSLFLCRNKSKHVTGFFDWKYFINTGVDVLRSF